MNKLGHYQSLSPKLKGILPSELMSCIYDEIDPAHWKTAFLLAEQVYEILSEEDKSDIDIAPERFMTLLHGTAQALTEMELADEKY